MADARDRHSRYWAGRHLFCPLSTTLDCPYTIQRHSSALTELTWCFPLFVALSYDLDSLAHWAVSLQPNPPIFSTLHCCRATMSSGEAVLPTHTIDIVSIESADDSLLPAFRQLARDFLSELGENLDYQGVEEELAARTHTTPQPDVTNRITTQ